MPVRLSASPPRGLIHCQAGYWKRWSVHKLCARTALLLPFLSFPGAIPAQTVTPSMTSPSIGRVVSAPLGTTVFRLAASSGTVTRQSGAGVRLGTGAARSLVTLSCGGLNSCNSSNVTVTVAAAGSPTGRAGQLSAFNIAMGTATLVTAPSGVGTVTFTVGPIGRNSSKTFYVGADLPVLGNESSLPTGTAQASFQVTTQTTSSASALGSISAAVSRPLAVSSSAALSFGRVIPPSVGTGTVSISPTDGTRSVSGGVAAISSPPSSRANFTVDGEGGQTISITVPSSFQMAGPTSLTVTTATNAATTTALSGTSGGSGSYSFSVGGTLPVSSSTPRGAYSGTLTVTASYN